MELSYPSQIYFTANLYVFWMKRPVVFQRVESDAYLLLLFVLLSGEFSL